MNKIYLDCSKEFILPADHGIPRVVRCLSLDKRITPIVLYKNKFYKINKLQSEDVKKKNSSRSIVSLIKKILSLAISYNHTKTLKSFLVKKYYQKRINKKKIY